MGTRLVVLVVGWLVGCGRQMEMELWMWYVLVGLVWGGSNPLLKRGALTATSVPPYTWAGPLGGVLAETVHLFTTPSYLLPFAANQGGSLLFLVCLGNALGEPVSQNYPLTFAGMALVSLGIYLCVS